MAYEWLEYIRKFDNLIQEALRACVKNSLSTFYQTLHGDGRMGPSPLIHIDIDLKDEKTVSTLKNFKMVYDINHYSPDKFQSIHGRNKRILDHNSNDDCRIFRQFSQTF